MLSSLPSNQLSDVGWNYFPYLRTRLISSFRMMDILPQKTIVMVERY